jgi:acid phosphatase
LNDHATKDTPSGSGDLPDNLARRRIFQAAGAVGIAAGLPSPIEAAAPKTVIAKGSLDDKLKAHIKTVVVIYMENRSFNNLFANFPGTAWPLSAVTPEQAAQKDRDGTVLKTLPKIWGGMVPNRQDIGGKEYIVKEDDIKGLPNAPFKLMDAEGKPLSPGLITRDLWHRFYQNQQQINGGKNDGFAAWGDTGGMTMGYYGDTREHLGLWQVAREYTLCDNFFMGAFGGSYMNHQFLIAARCNEYFHAPQTAAKKLMVELSDGPQGMTLALAPDSPASAMDGKPKYIRDGTITPDGYIVNSAAPPYQPSHVRPAPGGDPLLADPDHASTCPPQTYDTIGDLLSQKSVTWAWYGAGWQAALDQKGGGHKPNFQSHHQPFNFFKNFAPGTQARADHLRDGGLGDSPMSNKFLADVVAGKLPAVSFYKPQGNLNMHAGNTDIESGDQHVTNLLQHLKESPQWKNMLVVVTFDENGGWWDNVPAPKGDRWGPGTRLPCVVVSPFAKKGAVDHTFYDTTSIIRFITRLHGLPLLEGVQLRNAAFASRGATPPGDLTGTLSFR